MRRRARSGVVIVGAAALALGAGLPARSSAEGDPPATTRVVPPVLDDVEHMCALLTGCDRLPLPTGLVPRDFVTCVRSTYDELASGRAVTYSLTLKECGLKASSCGELRTCALRGAKAETCTGRGKAGTGPVDVCDGDGRAVTCENERITTVRDCPRGGEQCVVKDGHAFCALGSCKDDSPAACSASGTRILECKKGKLVSLDCAAFGLTCVQESGGPVCATKAASCTEGATRCDGGAAIACFHGHEVKVDCGAVGLACGGAGQATVGACAMQATSSTCDATSAPRCDGATLRWCAWGTPRAYPCKSMGLAKCVTDDKGAHCAG